MSLARSASCLAAIGPSAAWAENSPPGSPRCDRSCATSRSAAATAVARQRPAALPRLRRAGCRLEAGRLEAGGGRLEAGGDQSLNGGRRLESRFAVYHGVTSMEPLQTRFPEGSIGLRWILHSDSSVNSAPSKTSGPPAASGLPPAACRLPACRLQPLLTHFPVRSMLAARTGAPVNPGRWIVRRGNRSMEARVST